MPARLISPNRRRIVNTVDLGLNGMRQLASLGWQAYEGPGQVTADLDEHGNTKVFRELGITPPDHMSGAIHTGARNGWYVPGTDPAVDRQRVPVTAREV